MHEITKYFLFTERASAEICRQPRRSCLLFASSTLYSLKHHFHAMRYCSVFCAGLSSASTASSACDNCSGRQTLLAGAVRQAGPFLRVVDPPVDHQARLLERAAEEAVDGLLSLASPAQMRQWSFSCCAALRLPQQLRRTSNFSADGWWWRSWHRPWAAAAARPCGQAFDHSQPLSRRRPTELNGSGSHAFSTG